MTPETVSTRIGTLEFVDAVPSDETVRVAYDNLDFLRGVEVLLNFIPAASIEAPPGTEPNWTETVAGKNWFAILRVYGPIEPWFDKSGRPREIEALA